MMFDAVAFAMGAAGVSRDVVSALMGGSSGGGVPGSLEESGWVLSAVGKAVVTKNIIDMPTGSSATRVNIAPPTDVQASRRFVAGDELKIAFKLKSVSNRCSVTVDDNSRATATSKTGLFTFNGARGYATTTGEDVLTWAFTGTMQYVGVYPAANTGATSSNVSAEVEVTGMAFNGVTLFGKV